MMKTLLKYLIVSILLISSVGCVLAQEKEIKLTAEAPDEVIIGNRFRLTFKLSNAEGGEITFPDYIEGFKILEGPDKGMSESTAMINGKTISYSSVTFVYNVVPIQEGNYTLPRATVSYNGKTYKSEAPVIKVISSGQRPVSFDVQAPEIVRQGERFRVNFVLKNEDADSIKFPDNLKDVTVVYGPAVSTSQSTNVIKGIRETTTARSFSYIMIAEKAGKVKLPSASVTAGGKTYKTKPVTIEVEGSGRDLPGRREANKKRNQKNKIEIKDEDSFIRSIVTEVEIQGEKAFEVTFRLYTTVNVQQVEKTNYPAFSQFDIIRSWTPSTRMRAEKYEGRNYYTADIRKFLLVPKRAGTVKVDGGQVDVLFRVKTGEVERSFFGPVKKYEEVRKTLTIEPFEIEVGLVGDYQLAENNSGLSFPRFGSFSINDGIYLK